MAKPRKTLIFKRLASMPAQRPKTKAGQVRWLWPEIHAALNAGHSLKEISAALAADGITVSYAKFRLYIARLKKSMVHIPLTAPNRQPALHQAESPAPPQQDDPLANVKNRSNRPTFEYRPGVDEDKLF